MKDFWIKLSEIQQNIIILVSFLVFLIAISIWIGAVTRTFGFVSFVETGTIVAMLAIFPCASPIIAGLVTEIAQDLKERKHNAKTSDFHADK